MSQSTQVGPVAPGTFRAPRAQVLLNGEVMQGVAGVSWKPNGQFEAATFSVDADIQQTYAMNRAWWSQQKKITAQIQVGYLQAGSIAWTTVLTGLVDDYEIDLDHSVIALSGRDLAAQLIDTKTANTWANLTSSEIATKLAGMVALTPVVTPTTTIVGTYYAIDTTTSGLGAFHQDITYWDLLVYLAQQEGFDLFVSGSSLYFQPLATSKEAYHITWQDGPAGGLPVSNVIGLKLRHSLTLAKGVSVTVKSHNSALRKSFTAKTADPDYKTSDDAATQDYVFYVPNLTPQQAIELANQRYADITRHLRVIEFEAPGDTILTPRKVIILSGTGTTFDTQYYPDEIDLSLSQEGFTMMVTAKNVPPTPSALIPNITGSDGVPVSG